MSISLRDITSSLLGPILGQPVFVQVVLLVLLVMVLLGVACYLLALRQMLAKTHVQQIGKSTGEPDEQRVSKDDDGEPVSLEPAPLQALPVCGLTLLHARARLAKESRLSRFGLKNAAPHLGQGTESVELVDFYQPEDVSDAVKQLKRHGVRGVCLVHGTFVGSNPLGLDLKGRWLKSLPESFRSTWADMRRKGRDYIKDFGTFNSQHEAQLAELFGSRMSVIRFNWSSANHHLARLEAAVELADKLLAWRAGIGRRWLGGRLSFLFIAHSHGGQVLALLTHLIYSKRLPDDLLEVLSEMGVDAERRRQWQQKLSGLQLIILTQGSPVRYAYFEHAAVQLIHLVYVGGEGLRAVVEQTSESQDKEGNSQKDEGWAREAQKWRDWWEQKGDRIQRLGGAGTDLLAPNKDIRLLNKRLDRVLGPGTSAEVAQKLNDLTLPLHPQGKTLLVDYGRAPSGSSVRTDQGVDGVLGHGVYTRLGATRFTIHCLASQLTKKMRLF